MNESELIQILFQNLIDSELFPFPQQGRLNITNQHGVYIIYNPQGIVSHVGNTTRGQNGLRQRLNNHISNNSSFTRNFLLPQGLTVRMGYSFKFLIIVDPRQRMLVEALSIGRLCPQYIGTHQNVQQA